MRKIWEKKSQHLSVDNSLISVLTLVVGVQQCSLEAHHTVFLQVLINGNVHAVGVVRIDVGQCQEISRTNEEISMKSVHT